MAGTRKPRREKTLGESIEFRGHQIQGGIARLPSDTKPLTKDQAKQLALNWAINEAARRARAKKEGHSFWTPDYGVYYNRETKRLYKPHHKEEELFVYTDTPTNAGVLGSEGCVAAETLIEEVPVAEWQGGQVSTIFGSAISSSAYRKGRADLYRVKTRLGTEVVVTLQHRFLTPVGWNQTQFLSVGSQLAARDSARGRQSPQRATDFLGRYWQDFRPCDEQSILAQGDAQLELRQLANSLCGEHYLESFHSVLRDHFYSGDGSCHAAHFPSKYECELLLQQIVDAENLFLYDIDARLPTETTLNCTEQLPLLILQHLLSLYEEHQFPYELNDRILPKALSLTALLFQYIQSLNCTSQEFLSYVENALSLCLNEFCAAIDFSLSSKYPLYNVVWDSIDDISFVGNGEFYDLTVPVGSHYEAHGLYHHNSGKSVSGIIKTCERIRRGMSGVLCSPDLPHFRRSLWTEFKRWLPDDVLLDDQQYRLNFDWEPREPFTLAFKNGATLLCGGIEDASAFEGPNINFYHFDEARRAKDASAIKVLKGRIRIPGAHNEPPQGWITTTKPNSTDHWVFEYYGPIQKDEEGNENDEYLSFKKDLRIVALSVKDNLVNLSDGFLEQRAQGLSPEEIAILIENEWGDVDDVQNFLPSLALWDNCRDVIPPLDERTPLVLALDGAEVNDVFGAVAGSWHPEFKQKIACVRWVRAWEPKGTLLNFDEIEKELLEFIATHNVVLLTFDAALIRQLCRRLSAKVWTREFSQGRDRLAADKSLLDAIIARTIIHDGNPLLRRHFGNAAKKIYGDDGRKMRMVKMGSKSKIDLAVATSMMHDWVKNPALNLLR